MEARMQWDNVFKVLLRENCQPKILYPTKLSFKTEDKNTFPDKQKLREFVADDLLYKNNKGISSSQKQVTLDSNSYPQCG